MRRGLGIAAVVVGAFAIGTWWAMPSDDAPAQAALRGEHATAPVSPAAELSPSPSRVHAPELATHTATTDRAERHPRSPDDETVDPCTAVVDPDIPAGYDQLTTNNITIAWKSGATPGPTDRELHPALLASIVSSLLDEAADAAGTPVRTSLVVIIYPTRREFRALTHAPVWASGLYDGGVQLPAAATADIGVDMATLRHEVMHAQMHHALGCQPIWFAEGVAMLFAGETPAHELFQLAHDREGVPVETLGVSSLAKLSGKLSGKQKETLYAQFLAMTTVVLDAIEARDEHGSAGVPALRQLVAALSLLAPDQRLASWGRFTDLDVAGVADALAMRVFGTHDLEPLLAGTLCCSGLYAPRDFRCHAAPAHDGSDHVWLDRSQSPPSMCDAHW